MWRYLFDILIVVGLLGVLVPLGVSGFSRYSQKASESRWQPIIEKAERLKKARPIASVGMLAASGDGFAPNSAVSVSFDGARVATGKADGQGRISVQFRAPDGAGPGLHMIMLRGVTSDGTPLTLTANTSLGSAVLAGLGIPSGREIAFLRIDAIGVKTGVREDATWSSLVKGPAHVVGTAPIGELGTTLISGHRTMFAAPFSNLDKVKKGDTIKLYTKSAIYEYRVTGNRIANPTDMSDVAEGGSPRLVLSTCEPRFYSTSRLLVLADLAKEYSY